MPRVREGAGVEGASAREQVARVAQRPWNVCPETPLGRLPIPARGRRPCDGGQEGAHCLGSTVSGGSEGPVSSAGTTPYLVRRPQAGFPCPGEASESAFPSPLPPGLPRVQDLPAHGARTSHWGHDRNRHVPGRGECWARRRRSASQCPQGDRNRLHLRIGTQLPGEEPRLPELVIWVKHGKASPSPQYTP